MTVSDVFIEFTDVRLLWQCISWCFIFVRDFIWQSPDFRAIFSDKVFFKYLFRTAGFLSKNLIKAYVVMPKFHVAQHDRLVVSCCVELGVIWTSYTHRRSILIKIKATFALLHSCDIFSCQMVLHAKAVWGVLYYSAVILHIPNNFLSAFSFLTAAHYEDMARYSLFCAIN